MGLEERWKDITEHAIYLKVEETILKLDTVMHRVRSKSIKIVKLK